MKRIVSILAAIAIVLSFSTMAFAADIAFTLETDAESYKAGEMIELSIASGSTKVTGLGINIKYDTTAISVAKDDGALLIDKNGMTAIGIECAEKDYGFSVAAGSATAKKVAVVAYLQISETALTGDYTITPVVSSPDTTLDGVEFTNITAEPIVIHIDGVEPAGDKVEMTAEPFITEVATSEEQDGWQAGQAVALQFATADLADFIAMNWKLTVADVNKFAKVDDAAFATIKATAAETVDVFASFIVNTAENKTATPITAVSAGFLKADGTVVEAE